MDPSSDTEPHLSLDGRLQLLRESSQASEAVIAFARDEAIRIAEELGVSIETQGAGMLVTHLVLAIERARRGEFYIAPDGVAEMVEAELREQPRVYDRARELAARAREQLDAELPRSEIDFLAIHLAALIAANDGRT